MDVDTSYLLLTPGPLTTSATVRDAMRRDWSTWDSDYHAIVQSVRERLVALAVPEPSSRPAYTAVLMQGSGTFAVEATIGSVVPQGGKLLIAKNGAYGARMAAIASRLGIAHDVLTHGETEPIDPARVRAALREDPAITHVGLVHCETTTGILNDAQAVGELASELDKCLILDAMSSLGGVPFDAARARAHYVISSANKCIEGVPGFGFVVADRARLEAAAGCARSLSLDLYDQWREMETKAGKWRFTSPTHVVLAFDRALDELAAEGGVEGRSRRYRENQRALVEGMARLGFATLLPESLQSPVITTFHEPRHSRYSFPRFFELLKARGFFIYPGKVTDAATFRIGSIGQVFPADIGRLLAAIEEVQREMGFAA